MSSGVAATKMDRYSIRMFPPTPGTTQSQRNENPERSLGATLIPSFRHAPLLDSSWSAAQCKSIHRERKLNSCSSRSQTDLYSSFSTSTNSSRQPSRGRSERGHGTITECYIDIQTLQISLLGSRVFFNGLHITTIMRPSWCRTDIIRNPIGFVESKRSNIKQGKKNQKARHPTPRRNSKGEVTVQDQCIPPRIWNSS